MNVTWISFLNFKKTELLDTNSLKLNFIKLIFTIKAMLILVELHKSKIIKKCDFNQVPSIIAGAAVSSFSSMFGAIITGKRASA